VALPVAFYFSERPQRNRPKPWWEVLPATDIVVEKTFAR